MPSIGKDLVKIRSYLGLSIQDIQHSTKIPVSTLESIENDSIFTHLEENQIYIRSFVRSYGRALKINDDIMIKALDQHETGNYNHLLLQEFPGLRSETSTPSPSHAETETVDESLRKTEQESDPSLQNFEKEGEQPRTESGTEATSESKQQTQQSPYQPEKIAPAPPQKREQPDFTRSPSVKNVNWADVGRKFTEEKKHTPVWLVGLIIVLIIAAILGYFLYQNGYLDFGETSSNEPPIETNNEVTQNGLSLDMDETAQPEESGEVQKENTNTTTVSDLDDVLFLTVYAAYDALGPVRIWSDIKPRMDPYWLEQGTAMRFEFRDTVRIRGSYPDLLLFKNGHLIENAVQQYLNQEENYIEITRSDFTSDPKWATTVDFELPEGVPSPDTVSNRPTF